jgi:hypothetical protein
VKKDILQGVFEMHVHCSPDIVPRKTDDLSLITSAAGAGMGGVLLKSHFGSTVERAQLLQKMVPDIHVFGSLCLNHPVGGLNPNTVDIYTQLGVKEIFMPTLSAQAMFNEMGRHQSDQEKKESTNSWKGENWPWDKYGKGISILDERGKLVEAVFRILEIIAASGVILGTGHLSIAETRALIDAALDFKIKRLLITHPEYLAAMDTGDQVALAKKGVFFERCYLFAPEFLENPVSGGRFQIMARNIKAVGIESNVLATDFGQPANLHPIEGMKSFLRNLQQAGFSDDEIETMSVRTPAYLLQP